MSPHLNTKVGGGIQGEEGAKEEVCCQDQVSQTETGPMLIKGRELQDYIDDECPEDYPGDVWIISDCIDSKSYFRIKRVPEDFTRINAGILRNDFFI